MKLIQLILFISYSYFSFSQSEEIYERAQKHFGSDEFELAIDQYSKIISLKDSFYLPLAYYGRASSYIEIEKFSKAKTDAKCAIKESKSHIYSSWIKGSSLWSLSMIKSRKKSNEKSLQLLKEASQYMETTLLYTTIGFEEIYLGKYDDAIISLNYSIKLDSNNSWAYNNRALAYLKLEKLEKAMADVNKSISMDNQNPFAFKHRALIYIEQGELNLACNDLTEASTLSLLERMSDQRIEEIDKLIQNYCK